MHCATQATTPVDAVRACVEQVSRTLAIARSLVCAGNQVDVTGLDAEVGFVCARVLDLPRDEGRAVRPILMVLRAELDALAGAMEQSGSRSPRGSSACPDGQETAA
ncbi:MAG TPA: hypothetical protein VME47_16710 [Acetobacteraceae bacterium]|nr:hypothetical protein [Acetobacteraceae bacterium]